MMIFGPLFMLFGFMVAVLGVVLLLRLVTGAGASTSGHSCGRAAEGRPTEARRDEHDPLDIVRERYARGEIDHDELERYLANLLPPRQPNHPASAPRG
ncbi:MAG: SHOCT domain-containing protein [Acidimicrobiales bacterium]